MSVKVELDALADEVAQRPFGYLLTAGDDGPPHSGAAVFSWVEGRLVTGAGKKAGIGYAIAQKLAEKAVRNGIKYFEENLASIKKLKIE